MISTLIISKNTDKALAAAYLLCDEYHIAPLDRSLFHKEIKATKKPTGTQSIGIEDILSWQNTLFLKPLHGEMKASIISNAELLTIQAQNALLKILEEPPNNTIIIVTATSDESFLPTILSRCKVIHLREDQPKIQQQQYEDIQTDIESVVTGTPANALFLAEKLTKEKNEIPTLEIMIHILREKLISQVADKTASTALTMYRIQQCQQTLTILKTTNTNSRLTLEHLFLSLIV